MITKTCRNCLDTFPLHQLAISKVSTHGRDSSCKPCRSTFEANRRLVKLANTTPEDFMMCNSCDRFFSKRVGRGIITDKCRYCKSTDVEEC